MIYRFVNEGFRYLTKEIKEDEAAETAIQDKYFSIGINYEHYIFFIKETYIEQTLDKIMIVKDELNKELLIANHKLKEYKTKDIKILEYYIFLIIKNY